MYQNDNNSLIFGAKIQILNFVTFLKIDFWTQFDIFLQCAIMRLMLVRLPRADVLVWCKKRRRNILFCMYAYLFFGVEKIGR